MIDFATLSAQVAGACTLGYGAWRWGIRPVWRFCRKVNMTMDQGSRAYPILMDVAAQFSPNGGNSLRDVIDEMRMEQAMGRERHRAMIDSLRLAYLEVKQNGLVRSVSKNWTELTGLVPEESIGMGWLNGVASPERDEVREEWMRAINEQRDFDHRFHTVKGTEVHCHSFVARSEKTGKVLGFVAVVQAVGVHRICQYLADKSACGQ